MHTQPATLSWAHVIDVGGMESYQRAPAYGANPVQLTRGMEKTVAGLVQELKKLSKVRGKGLPPPSVPPNRRPFSIVAFPFNLFYVDSGLGLACRLAADARGMGRPKLGGNKLTFANRKQT